MRYRAVVLWNMLDLAAVKVEQTNTVNIYRQSAHWAHAVTGLARIIVSAWHLGSLSKSFNSSEMGSVVMLSSSFAPRSSDNAW